MSRAACLDGPVMHSALQAHDAQKVCRPMRGSHAGARQTASALAPPGRRHFRLQDGCRWAIGSQPGGNTGHVLLQACLVNVSKMSADHNCQVRDRSATGQDGIPYSARLKQWGGRVAHLSLQAGEAGLGACCSQQRVEAGSGHAACPSHRLWRCCRSCALVQQPGIRAGPMQAL